MSKAAETPDQTQSLLFGLTTVHDWIDKARRERDCFLAESDKTAKTDHALNLAITLSHAEDWVHRLHIQGNVADWPEQQRPEKWRAWVRQQCPAMLLLADLCNAAKHRILHVRGSATATAEIGTVGYIIEHLRYAEDFIGRVRKFSTVLNVRTHMEDDEIAYLDVRAETHKLTGPDGFSLFVDVCNQAIRFSDEFLKTRGL
jgi:hypothetical protein